MPTKPDTEYLERGKSRRTGPRDAVDERRDRDLDRDRDRDRDRDQDRDRAPVRDPPTDNKQLSLAMSNRMVRLRVSVGVLGTIAVALGGLAMNLLSYAKGLGEDGAQRAAALAEVREVRNQLDEHEKRLTQIVAGYQAEIQRSNNAMRTMAQVQLLQWAYVTQVVEAARARKPIPMKPPDLIEAEAKAAIAIRDKP